MPAGIDVGLAVAALYAGAIAAVVAFRSLRRLWQSVQQPFSLRAGQATQPELPITL